jgi:methionyl aminopeptidase
MIHIKNKSSIAKMEAAGQLLAEIFNMISLYIHENVSTLELDAWIENQLREKGLVSQTKGYHGYRHVSCISVNEEVVHGVPMRNKILRKGDLVKIDICASWQGYCADMARAFFVGAEVPLHVQQLVNVAQQALDKGIEQARAGNRLSDISAAIQVEVERHGFGIVRDFAGHGIGKKMHEEPEVLNYGNPGQGPLLRPGMALAIEPMITMGKHDVYVTNDGWTVKTKDKSLAAHVEDTVVITEDAPKILTRFNRACA